MDFQRGLITLVPMVLSLSVHEWAHAWSAWRLGDDTAARQGRMTLNPASHIDLFGTLLLPFFLAAQGLPGFGWAKPVPVDPTRFNKQISMGKGMAITASAGPISNIVLAVLATVGFAVVIRFRLDVPEGAIVLLQSMIGMNVSLAVFNLIPVPPLDGSRVVAWLVPYNLRHYWHQVEVMAPFLLLLLFFFGGRLISGPSFAVLSILDRLFQSLL